MKRIVQREFEKGKNLPLIMFPEDGTAVPETTRLSLVVLDPSQEWTDNGTTRPNILRWTRERAFASTTSGGIDLVRATPRARPSHEGRGRISLAQGPERVLGRLVGWRVRSE